jgi:hypothetical protein
MGTCESEIVEVGKLRLMNIGEFVFDRASVERGRYFGSGESSGFGIHSSVRDVECRINDVFGGSFELESLWIS